MVRTLRKSPNGPGRSERRRRLRVLTLNCGSSTLKFDLLDAALGGASPVRVLSGAVERIGSAGRVALTRDGSTEARDVQTRDHADAFAEASRTLEQAGALDAVDAVGHRVVHGGLQFLTATRIDARVIDAIREATDLAPLHNRPALAVIEAAVERFGAEVPMVACFDTSFFAGLPEVASRYALPKDLSERFGIRRFGFHGLAHGDMTRRFQALRPDVLRPRLITLMLGGGCSATASFDGAPLDTSMGYTPLEGLVMGTRSGDIDPALPLRLQTLMGRSAAEIEDLLNEQSGLLGLSGRSGEMRDLAPAAADGDQDAAFAIEKFCESVRKYIGAYLAVLGGADAIIFGGGVGENMAEVRAHICHGFEWAGLQLDPDANAAAHEPEARISALGSSIDAWVVRVDEASVIARETMAVLTP